MRRPIVLAEALRPRLVGAGLLSEHELDPVLRECERCTLDRYTYVTTFLVARVWGRKPEEAASVWRGGGQGAG